MNETKEQREERKNNYISYVLRKAKGFLNEEFLIKEASEKFEKENERESISQ